jgi:hypothetical protein
MTYGELHCLKDIRCIACPLKNECNKKNYELKQTLNEIASQLKIKNNILNKTL